MRMSAGTLGRLLRCTSGMAALEFVFIAPALLLLAFGIIIYSIYFSAMIGVSQAASEGARAAVAGLSTSERTSLAQARAAAVMKNYSAILGGGSDPVISAGADGTGVFKVQVSYDMSKSPIMRYGNMVPLPSPNLTASASVTNGGY
ncbi:TadE-like protein [Novosphingobium sp. PhB165]|uniref:TadE/TadG family type IV pilus assembly protein n=1 Tax=Novosphingobium sp. PhB165 TaxID=2485105 RepID=UPI0010439A3F|nr:TadE/TadG family type IV pilus assembly protein [Novosphingobium sp. PhB165]TCM15366.1 TadE-like protein [Novosphingobium sp. PhB165]